MFQQRLKKELKGMVPLTIPYCVYALRLAVCFIESLEVGEEKVVMIIVYPQEGENRGVVGNIKMLIAIDSWPDNSRHYVDDNENHQRAYQKHRAEGV